MFFFSLIIHSLVRLSILSIHQQKYMNQKEKNAIPERYADARFPRVPEHPCFFIYACMPVSMRTEMHEKDTRL